MQPRLRCSPALIYVITLPLTNEKHRGRGCTCSPAPGAAPPRSAGCSRVLRSVAFCQHAPRHFRTHGVSSHPVVSSSEKMAAVVVSADGGVAPLDSDCASPRIPSPAPEQTLQNNALLGLPIVAIENILNFLTYDEISLLRLVRKQRVSARLRSQAAARRV